jgi:hypothetical protein
VSPVAVIIKNKIYRDKAGLKRPALILLSANIHRLRGRHLVLHNVLYRKLKPVKQHVAVLWRTGQDKPWYLMTNLEKLRAKQLPVVFGRRMTIEEYFRDAKSKRNDFALRLTLIKGSQRLSRLLLILALAYVLLITVGLYCCKRFRPSRWCSTTYFITSKNRVFGVKNGPYGRL